MGENRRFRFRNRLIAAFLTAVLILFIIGFAFIFFSKSVFFLSWLVILFSLFFTAQGIFTLMWMLYAWQNSNEAENEKSPITFKDPIYSFTALIPARHEKLVIGDTIRAISQIDYPESLKETIVICREDDTETISAAEEKIKLLGKDNIKLLVIGGFPINKPHSLNVGLKNSSNEIITVFDAEDQPHKDIYKIINTTIVKENSDVVQSGVQLMNYKSRWFSVINVLEYFFWFKSGLLFFERVGKVTPLGGNTVFIKRPFLEKIGGWDENCLTEDADLGLRLVMVNAKVKIIYDPNYVTKEETPNTVRSFIKQRTRWNQGFLQILLKKDWRNLIKFRQKAAIFYILVAPLTQIVILMYIPVGVWISSHYKLPVSVSIISFIPLYVFLIQFGIYLVGLMEFADSYKVKGRFWCLLRLVAAFLPYQLLLIVSSFRALLRILKQDKCWEKTDHKNAHRFYGSFPAINPTYAD